VSSISRKSFAVVALLALVAPVAQAQWSGKAELGVML